MRRSGCSAAPADSYVENFLGFDRGIRRLSFLAASGLSLDDRAVVDEDASAAMAAQVAREAGEDWALVVDGGRKPRGWAAAGDLEALPAGSQAGQARLEPYGHTFDVRTDSLRAALDATVLSPAGRAVGVDEDGRAIGVTSYERLRVAIHADEQGLGRPAAAAAAAAAADGAGAPGAALGGATSGGAAPGAATSDGAAPAGRAG